MDSQQTTKELLHSILFTQEERAREDKIRARKQLDEAAEISSFMNAQKDVNQELLRVNATLKGYLESNSATNQEGAIEKLDRLEKTVIGLKTSIDKKIAFFTGSGLVILGISKWLITKIFV